MATTNYTALLKLPYRINNTIKGSRFDQVKFNIQNLSSQVGGNINFSMTGSITSGLVLYNGNTTTLYGHQFASSAKTSENLLIDILASNDYTIRYETTSANITSVTGGIIIQGDYDSFVITCSAFMSYVTIGLSSSLSASSSTGTYDNSDAVLSASRLTIQTLATKSAITGLTGNSTIDYFIRSGSGGYRVRAFSIKNTGSNDVLNFTATVENASSYPTPIFAIKSVDNTTIQTINDREIIGVVQPGNTAIFIVEFGKGSYVGYKSKEVLNGILTISHNAENIDSPARISLRSQSSIANAVEETL